MVQILLNGFFMFHINSHITEQFLPCLIRQDVYGTTFKKSNETLFLRMELVTEKNTQCWAKFKAMNSWIANLDSRGVLSGLVGLAGTSSYPDYESIKEITGFSNEEYVSFTNKALTLKKKTDNKIVDVIEHNSVGSNHMATYVDSEGGNYIVYVSNIDNFSIQDAHDYMTHQPTTLQTYIEAYKHILISVGSSFSKGNSIHNRGISRNPYWVFEEKYAGLSMLLLGFSGAVAEQYFPDKTIMHVKPVGSMQCIIKRNLLLGEGYITRKGEKIDVTDLEVSPNDPEGNMNYITISAITRIYRQTIGQQFR
jgi:hypothetical protein